MLKRFEMSIPGDFDNDSDVDMTDFAHVQKCMTQPGVNPGPGCGDADLNADSAIDSLDVNVFAGCLRGANQTPGCS